jgi:hypothetical protein
MELNKLENLSLFISRLIAFAIDNLIAWSILFFVYHSLQPNFLENYFLVFILILAYEFYFIFFEIICFRTPGKLLMGLKISIKKNDEMHFNTIKKFFSNLFEIFVRNLTRILIFIPPLFLWNELLIIIFNKGKTIRELITSTEIHFSKTLDQQYYK